MDTRTEAQPRMGALIVTAQPGQKIVLRRGGVLIAVIESKGRVSLRISAPIDIKVGREEGGEG